MNQFLRQIVAFSGLWALCELLLPEGGISRIARLVVSLMVMTVLVTSLMDALSGWTGGQAVSTATSMGDTVLGSARMQEEAMAESYQRAYLRSQANQAEDICVRMARGAGFEARAAVYLQQDGGLERIELRVKKPGKGDARLLSMEELQRKIVEVFLTEASRVMLIVDEGESG